MSLDRTQKLVYKKVSELLCSQTDFSDKDRIAFLSDFMKVFGKNFETVLQTYSELNHQNKDSNLPVSDCCEVGSKETGQSSETQNCLTESVTFLSPIDDELEEAAALYEAVLITTTRQRSSAPSKLSKILGSTTRHSSLAMQEQHVDLPLSLPIAFTGSGLQEGKQGREIEEMLRKSCSATSEVALSVQADAERLSNISIALEIISENANHPTYKLTK
ncbi:uncharacterized protein LOC108672295 [Hyalella azteca]|uniref:Uncharacterized protein LOC108672295 n=1 Tax=Hyalella azteca TaxID=294128 RepID=A0A8B7NP00_HYAAZ|nr:uncharacterized protein LOC108672295 [Hyalella azteca]